MFRFAISKKTWVLYKFVWFYTHSCGFIHIRVVYTHMCTVYTHMRAVFHQQCSMFIYLLMKIGTAACFFSWFGFKANICARKLLCAPGKICQKRVCGCAIRNTFTYRYNLLLHSFNWNLHTGKEKKSGNMEFRRISLIYHWQFSCYVTFTSPHQWKFIEI